MADLLFECFSEEVPARMQSAAIEQLDSKLTEALKSARLNYDSIESFVSPRHLCVRVKGLPTIQPDQTIERKGPKTTAPDAAIAGFLKSTGMSKDQLGIRMVGKDECYFAVINEKGRNTAEALHEIFETILQQFHWPKSQRWGGHSISWVRPLQNICCIFNGEIIPVIFGHLSANNLTYGHRFLAPNAITIYDITQYESYLENAHVMVNAAKRKATIHAEMLHLATQYNLTLVEDEGLLSEVTGLVEWPIVLMGEFDASFLDLPPEVLVSEMRHHQKYFALKNADGTLSNRFMIVSNMITKDDGKAVIHGNGRVLRARLSDGAFFWNQDRNKSLADWAKELHKVTFHDKIGSVADKVDRITNLAQYIATQIPTADKTKIVHAASLCKADLVTGMVGEFPELQGTMGRYYAINQQINLDVANAIADHYLPIGPHSPVPSSPTGTCIALADKIDTLVCMFAIGEKPTGSKDPFALRRATLGIIRIILENQLNLQLNHIINQAGNLFYSTSKSESGLRELPLNIKKDILDFFAERLKVMLRDQSIRHDYVNAAMSHTDETVDLLSIASKARALSEFLATDDGVNLLAAYRRASNMVAAEEKKDATHYASVPDKTLFKLDEEKTLFDALEAIAAPLKDALMHENNSAAMAQLATLRASVDAYLENVLVNVEDGKLRINRLYTLSLIRKRMDEIVDFGLIEG